MCNTGHDSGIHMFSINQGMQIHKLKKSEVKSTYVEKFKWEKS